MIHRLESLSKFFEDVSLRRASRTSLRNNSTVASSRTGAREVSKIVVTKTADRVCLEGDVAESATTSPTTRQPLKVAPSPQETGRRRFAGDWPPLPAECYVRIVSYTSVMILPQVHLRKPCYDFYFL